MSISLLGLGQNSYGMQKTRAELFCFHDVVALYNNIHIYIIWLSINIYSTSISHFCSHLCSVTSSDGFEFFETVEGNKRHDHLNTIPSESCRVMYNQAHLLVISYGNNNPLTRMSRKLRKSLVTTFFDPYSAGLSPTHLTTDPNFHQVNPAPYLGKTTATGWNLCWHWTSIEAASFYMQPNCLQSLNGKWEIIHDIPVCNWPAAAQLMFE